MIYLSYIQQFDLLQMYFSYFTWASKCSFDIHTGIFIVVDNRRIDTVGGYPESRYTVNGQNFDTLLFVWM